MLLKIVQIKRYCLHKFFRSSPLHHTSMVTGKIQFHQEKYWLNVIKRIKELGKVLI